MNINLYNDDLPDNLEFGNTVAVDTETLGLNIHRDRLCLVQLTFGDDNIHIVKFNDKTYNSPNLCRLLADESVLKIFHFARFDISVLKKYLGAMTFPIYCTKIASKLTRTYTDKHGLKSLVEEILDKKISKQQQSSDWGAEQLSDEQKQYAANDVIFLHSLKQQLDAKLKRTGRLELANEIFNFLPTRAILDLEGWDSVDIFSHS